MKTILVPVDFSKQSENAMAFAIKIARVFKSKIILMNAFESPLIYSDVAFATAQFDYSILYNSAVKQLKKFHDKFSSALGGIPVEMSVQQGLPSSRTIDLSLEKKAGMIVMGSTGTGRIERTLIGSNAARVLKNAPCKVLLVPEKASFTGFKKIVFGTDLSEENLKRASELIPFAKAFNSELIFLHIDIRVFRDNEEEDLRKVTAKIKKHVRYPKLSGYICSDANILNGISFFLKKQKADCLAMYTRQHGLLRGIFSPSFTRKASLHTSVPLLALHQGDFADNGF